MKNKHGWIIYNSFLPGDDFLDFAEWLYEAANKYNLSTEIVANSDVLVSLLKNSLSLLKEDSKHLPDFVIFTDKDIYLARQLELLGIRVFNSADAIEISDDKIATYQRLTEKKLPIPNTIIAPKIFPGSNEIHTEFINHITKTLSFPLIMKEAFGSFGEQVYLIHNLKEMIEKTKELAGKPFVYQEFISSSYGKDMRLHVVGNEVVASMIRQSTNDFRANITTGGTMEKYYPTKQEKELAIQATKAIEADFSGVDLLFGPNNEPIICEINSNAHIRNMYQCTNINVADFIIDYIIQSHKK